MAYRDEIPITANKETITMPESKAPNKHAKIQPTHLISSTYTQGLAATYSTISILHKP
jgi:hypothetical protein